MYVGDEGLDRDGEALLLTLKADRFNADLAASWFGLRQGSTGPALPRFIQLCRHWAQSPDCKRLDLLAEHAGPLDAHVAQGECVCPSRIVQLAGRQDEPIDAAERLMAMALGADHHAVPPMLLMAALLVKGDVGLPARIVYTRHARREFSACSGSIPHLVRAPEFAMVQTSDDFDAGLRTVNRLLKDVLRPDAPTVSFGLQLMDRHGKPPELLFHLSGPSISTALAVGTLWMLQDHIDDRFAELKNAVTNLRPDRLVVTAGLSGTVKTDQYGAPIAWPEPTPVGGFVAKKALYETYFNALKPYHASGQCVEGFGVPDPGYKPPLDLLALIEKMSADTGRGLNPPQVKVYQWCIDNEVGETIDEHEWGAAQDQAWPKDLDAWLVQQVVQAYNVAGRRRHDRRPAFGQPQAVQALTSPVILKPKDGSACRMDQLLGDGVASPWVISGPPLSGKSSLLASWVLRQARIALRSLSLRPGMSAGGQVEICLHVDLGILLRQAGDSRSPGWTGKALQEHLMKVAPWMTFEPDETGSPRIARLPHSVCVGFGEEALLHHEVKLRLLFDGLDADDAQRHEQATLFSELAQWLACQSHDVLLPPVFAMRSQDPADALHIQGWPGLRYAEVEPWSQADWRGYLDQPDSAAVQGLSKAAHRVLLRRLGLAGQAPAAATTEFQQFCTRPGHVAAICELLRQDPNADHLPTTPGRMLLALLWNLLVAAAKVDPVADGRDWLWNGLAADGVLSAARDRHWPPEPVVMNSGVVQGLAAMATALGDTRHDWVNVADIAAHLGWKEECTERWRAAVVQLNLVDVDPLDRSKLAFQQRHWRSLFLALSRQSPDRAGLPMSEEPLSSLYPRSHLPPVHPQAQNIRLAFDVACDQDRLVWMDKLLSSNLPLAAQLAIDHQPTLERLPHWALTLERLRAQLLHRGSKGGGTDLPRHLEAAISLGRLGDTLRYQMAPLKSQGDDGMPRTALRLHPKHWHWLSVAGADFHMAAFPVTQGEWDSFLAYPRACDPDALWWQDGGGAAVAWLKSREAADLRGLGMTAWRGVWANPLLPVTGISWYAARAYVAWARRVELYAELGYGDPDLPTEWEWCVAAGVIGDDGRSLPEGADFNHAGLALNRPVPVGLFKSDLIRSVPSRSDRPDEGLADLRGNVHQWCSSVFHAIGGFRPQQPDPNVTNVPAPECPGAVAVRGGSYSKQLVQCDVTCVGRKRPDRDSLDLGFRMVLRRRGARA